MTLVVLTHTLTPNTPENVSHVQQNLVDLRTVINGQLGDDNVTGAGFGAASLADAPILGLTESGVIRRGKCMIATDESRTNAAFGKLTTPDEVPNVVLPTDGLIRIIYSALWKVGASGTPHAAIFLNSNQLKIRLPAAAAPQVTEAYGVIASTWGALSSVPAGLMGINTTSALDFTSDVTTGQTLGSIQSGFTNLYGTIQAGGTSYQVPVGGTSGYGASTSTECVVFAAAGTYTVSVQYLCTAGGTVNAKERKLWVKTEGF